MATKPEDYLDCIRACCPDLLVREARFHNSDGQFNEVLLVNDSIVFRFPRSEEVAESFAVQVKILERIQPYVSLSVPRPVFQNLDRRRCRQAFMGYGKLPGEPLWRETFDAIRDETVLERIAAQLARFMQELHRIDVSQWEMDLPVHDEREEWAQLYEDFRQELYPYMRLDARQSVTRTFDKFLSDPRQFEFDPVLRHGDFGTSNILYDPDSQAISGVIDFDSIGLGDPAVDLGAVLNFGEDNYQRMLRTYPELAAMRGRTEFHRSTYALQEALYGLRLNIAESFEAGIAEYR